MILIRHGESAFNQHFNRTRQDPGIRDPELTEDGRAQIAATAEALRDQDLRQLLTSPYRRALQTAEILAGILDLPVEIDARIGEHAAFSCDVGSPTSDLAQRWPAWRFDHIDEEWWPTLAEPQEKLLARCESFGARTDLRTDRAHLAVVSHWGFIRGFTGLTVGNGTAIRVSAPPKRAAAIVYPR